MAERSKAHCKSARKTHPYVPRQRAFLITVHTPQKEDVAPFVTVQASHCNQTSCFPDLDSAFRHLSGLTHDKGGRKHEE